MFTIETWRLETLTAEATRNLVASWPRILLTAITIAGLIGALTWSEMSTTEEILAFNRDFVAAGGNVVVASHERGLPVGRCNALASRPEVLAAGSHARGDTVETNVAPGTLFQTAHITPGTLRVWKPTMSQPEKELAGTVAIGGAAAEELGVVDGMLLGFGGHRPIRLVVANVERRNPQAARWILIPSAPVGLAGWCWIELEPGAVLAGVDLLRHLFAGAEPELEVRSVIRLDEFARNPAMEFATRPEAAAWIPAGTVLTLLTWLGIWYRRSDLSLYRVLGTTRAGLWYQTQVETLTILVLAGAIGYLWAVAVYLAVSGANPSVDQYLVAARTTVSALLVPTVLGPLASLLIASRRSLLSQIKEG